MATQPEDTLETNLPDIDEEQEGEAEVLLDGEEAPLEGEGESSVIRDFRAREREKDKELRELRATVAAGSRPNAPAAPGERPTLEAFGFDEDKHGEALDKWYTDKHAFEEAQRTTTQQAEQVERARVEGYQTAKSATPIAGIDDAEKRVFAQVDDMTRNAILHAKSPALVSVLDRYPDRLAAISAAMAGGDVAEALMMMGELRGKAKIMPKTRSAPAPNRSATFRI